jgi:hypothetical protein
VSISFYPLLHVANPFSDFIRYVEDTFRTQNLRVNVLIMSPRLSEAAVVRRQIIEGVMAIVRLDAGSLAKGKVNVQIFDRRLGAGNVQFNGGYCAQLDAFVADLPRICRS